MIVNELTHDIIPFSLEFYLGIAGDEFGEDDGDSEQEGEEDEDDEDDEDEDQPQKKQKRS